MQDFEVFKFGRHFRKGKRLFQRVCPKGKKNSTSQTMGPKDYDILCIEVPRERIKRSRGMTLKSDYSSHFSNILNTF